VPDFIGVTVDGIHRARIGHLDVVEVVVVLDRRTARLKMVELYLATDEVLGLDDTAHAQGHLVDDIGVPGEGAHELALEFPCRARGLQELATPVTFGVTIEVIAAGHFEAQPGETRRGTITSCRGARASTGHHDRQHQRDRDLRASAHLDPPPCC
jgi:hypothetical protein